MARTDVRDTEPPGSTVILPTQDTALVRTSSAELDQALARRDALIAAAVHLVGAAAHDPDVGACVDAGCDLADPTAASPVDPVCELAHRLAALAPALRCGTDAGHPERTSEDDAYRHFVTTLEASLEAVRACRQVVHRGGGCWFASAPGSDGCAQVLRVAHLKG